MTGRFVGKLIGGTAGFAAGEAIGDDAGGAVGALAGFSLDRSSGPIFKALLDGRLAAPNAIAALSKTLGKFAKPLAEAAARGNQSLAATHFLLSRNPEYQKLTQEKKK